MVEFKIVIGLKNGKSYQKELKDNDAEFFIGKKLGEKVKGNNFGLEGYEFQITGGSDNSGFPMRKDVEGTAKKKILAVKGIGVKPKRAGQRQRKTVRGNTISAEIAQINLKVLKEGKEKFGVEKPEEAPEQKS
jgi:small subunit ribosomal protein S6e